jgi:hypothetical protein
VSRSPTPRSGWAGSGDPARSGGTAHRLHLSRQGARQDRRPVPGDYRDGRFTGRISAGPPHFPDSRQPREVRSTSWAFVVRAERHSRTEATEPRTIGSRAPVTFPGSAFPSLRPSIRPTRFHDLRCLRYNRRRSRGGGTRAEYVTVTPTVASEEIGFGHHDSGKCTEVVSSIEPLGHWFSVSLFPARACYRLSTRLCSKSSDSGSCLASFPRLSGERSPIRVSLWF